MWRSKALPIGAAVLLLAGGPLACKKKSMTRGAEEKQASGKKVLYWYDPMKPEVHFDHPGKSPFMDMQLEPKYAEEAPAPGAAAPPPGFSVVKIPLERRQEIGVTTAKVEKRTIGGAIETNGVVAEDEGRLNAVNAKFAGYIEKFYVDRTGQSVRRGQPLLTVYSPDLVATERELLLALENTRRLSSGSPQAASDASSLLSATRQRLRLWDIPESGDAVLILLIWAIGWLILRRPLWFETPGLRGYALMIASGLVIAALVEWVSVHLLRRWTYGPAMPIVPVLRIGVLPLLQLALLSPLVYWLASLVARWQRPAEGPATTIPLSRRSRRRDVP